MTDQRNLLRRVPWLRTIPLFLVPLLLVASYFPGEYQVPVIYWVTGIAAAAVFLVGNRAPLAVSVVLSGLAAGMFAEHAWGLAGLVPYLGAVGLAEAAMRVAQRGAVAVAALAWTAAVLVGLATETYATFWRTATLVETVAAVGLPLLLGLYLRSQRELADSYRTRAAEETARARTEERTALARELHDLVAHHMASIVLRIGVARHVVADADPQVRSVLDDVHATASGALTDIRRLLAALRDPDLGEVALVEPDAVAAEIVAAVDRTRAAGLTVDLTPLPSLDGLDAIGRLTLLRVVQESLTNAMKHADPAGLVIVALTSEGGVVVVDVGSTLASDIRRDRDPGHGLVGMTERTVLAGGTLDAGPDGDRWRVHARLPLGIEETTP
ncbi:sensor histidine kinase [Gordonia neofelifaecis]|uniref:histidine kinase n=1 Tax=Gordonia neofelifaecis NRRL B-59395 TaxID=644548 RepID=F1YDZ0_9ACTN|nr:histidine kinase [Gordonia neofelifaecis]EGD57080.1 two-component histidine kinase [Gordonia neofelifaecis NRRL B-59395]